MSQSTLVIQKIEEIEEIEEILQIIEIFIPLDKWVLSGFCYLANNSVHEKIH